MLQRDDPHGAGRHGAGRIRGGSGEGGDVVGASRGVGYIHAHPLRIVSSLWFHSLRSKSTQIFGPTDGSQVVVVSDKSK